MVPLWWLTPLGLSETSRSRFLGYSVVFDLSNHGPSDRCDLLPLLFAFRMFHWEIPWEIPLDTNLLALHRLGISGALSATCVVAAGNCGQIRDGIFDPEEFLTSK